jgi:hypothetical protein
MKTCFVLLATTIVFLCRLCVPIQAGVEVTRLDKQGRFASIEIKGEISRIDAEKFERLIGIIRPRFDVVEVELNSPGGDVLAAMDVGEVVRREWLWTTVEDDPGTECASACALIFAAGAVRIAGDRSKIGIHRPYFGQRYFAGLDREHARDRYDQLAHRVQNYLSKMGMSDRLYTEMMKISSQQIRVLTYTELEDFSLVGRDPGYEEWTRARSVAKYGEKAMKKWDAWFARSTAFVNQCLASGRSIEACAAADDRRHDPNPLAGK